jgi:hypothetical protein
MALVGSVAAVALLSIGAIIYFVDAQGRDRVLRDEANSVAEVRAFLVDNSWHPIADRAREKLARLDVDAWTVASTSGSIEALETYLRDARGTPEGAFVAQAEEQLATARQVQQVQQILYRLLIYRGDVNGAMNAETQTAIETFRYRWNMPVSSTIDAALMERLQIALDIWIHPRLEDLRAGTLEHTSEADFIRLANEFNVDGAALRAVALVESGGRSAFGDDGRPLLLFERHIFSRRTNRRYDESNPNVSSRQPGGYPRTQAERWAQLAEAYALDPEAALQSASYGMVQLMGFNYSNFGFETAGEYVRFMSQSEANQFEAFARFARANNLIDELQRHDWERFARGYNGPGYGANRYAELMAAAYAQISAEIAAENGSLLPGQTSRAPPAGSAQPETPPTDAQANAAPP